MVAVNLLVGCQTRVLTLESPADVRAALGKLGDASIEHATITFAKPLTCVQELIACATRSGAGQGQGTEVFVLRGAYYVERLESVSAVSADDAEGLWARIAATTGCPVVHVLGAHRSFVLSTAALAAPTWELAVYVDLGGRGKSAESGAGARGTGCGGERVPRGGRSPNFVVAVAPTDTVMDLKARLHALFRVLDPWDAVVVFGGAELAGDPDLGDHAGPARRTPRPTLQAIGLSNGASITLLRRQEMATDSSGHVHLAPAGPAGAAAPACGASGAEDGVVVAGDFVRERCTVVVNATDVLNRLASEHEHLREARAPASQPLLVSYLGPHVQSRTRSIPSDVHILDHVEHDGHPPPLALQSGEPAMQIFAKTLQGLTKALKVRRSDWVDDVRRAVGVLEGVPPAQLRMVLGGYELHDGRTLGDYRCHASATVHVMMRLRGGMHHASSLRRIPGAVEGSAGEAAVEGSTGGAAVEGSAGGRAVQGSAGGRGGGGGGCEPDPPGKRVGVDKWAEHRCFPIPVPVELLAGLRMSVHVVRPDLPIGATGAGFQGFACGATPRAAPGRAPVQVPGTKHEVHFGPSGVTSRAAHLQQHGPAVHAFASFEHLLANVGEAICGAGDGSAQCGAQCSAPRARNGETSLELVWRVALNIFRSRGTVAWGEARPLLQALLVGTPGGWDADAVREEWIRRSARRAAPAATARTGSSCAADAGDAVAGATD